MSLAVRARPRRENIRGQLVHVAVQKHWCRRFRDADLRSVIERVEVDNAMIGIAGDAATFKQMLAGR